MRFCLNLELDNQKIPLDYRSAILSYFKNAIQKYDTNVFEELYNTKGIVKQFTFSVYLGKCLFNHNDIDLSNKKIALNFSTNDTRHGIYFYNAFIGMKNIKYNFGQNYICLTNINIENEKVVPGDNVLIKTLSPIVIQDHKKDSNRDNYYSFSDQDYLKFLKVNIYNATKNVFNFDVTKDIENIKITPVKVKETKILYHNHKVKANLGTFVISAKNYLIDYLVKAGIGARRSQGFGMINIEREVKQ